MKIEVELLKIDQDTDKARACAVALLCVLPEDEAHQAVAEWRAVCMARSEDAVDLLQHYHEVSPPPEGTAVPPQDVGYSAAPMPSREAMREFVEEVAAAKDEPRAPQDAGYSAPSDVQVKEVREQGGFKVVPDYEVGGWVVTDLGELAQVVATRVGKDGGHLTVEVDEGEQQPVERTVRGDQVRPATTAEVTAGAARSGMGTATPGSQPVQDGGGKKKSGRPKKVTTPTEPDGPAAETAAVEVTLPEFMLRDFPTKATLQRMIDQEKEVKYAATSDKDLCKKAEHHAGRQRLFDLFKEHGVDRLGADAAKDASLRAAVLELVP